MVRVATLNLRGNANRWEERFPLITDVLHTLEADVIALQEVRLSIDQHLMLRDALNQHMEHPYDAHLCEDWYEPNILANAFLTQLPVIEHERFELPEGFRTAQRILLNVDGRSMNIVNTHLHHKPYRDERIRLKQLDCILHWLSQEPHPAILMGDLNARPHSETIHRAKERFQSAYKLLHGSEPEVTFPTPLRASEKLTPRTIDYILCDQTITVTTCQLIGDQPAKSDPTLYCSDHFGLMADIH